MIPSRTCAQRAKTQQAGVHAGRPADIRGPSARQPSRPRRSSPTRSPGSGHPRRIGVRPGAAGPTAVGRLQADEYLPSRPTGELRDERGRGPPHLGRLSESQACCGRAIAIREELEKGDPSQTAMSVLRFAPD